MNDHQSPAWRRLSVYAAALLAALMIPAAADAVSLKEIKERGYINIATEDNYAPFEIMQDDSRRASPTTSSPSSRPCRFRGPPGHPALVRPAGRCARGQVRHGDHRLDRLARAAARLRFQRADRERAALLHQACGRRPHQRGRRSRRADRRRSGGQRAAVAPARARGDARGDRRQPRRVVEYTSYPEIYEDLQNGRLDYTVNSVISAQSLISKRGDEFEMGEPVSGPGFHAYPVPKGNPELLAYHQRVHPQAARQRPPGRAAGEVVRPGLPRPAARADPLGREVRGHEYGRRVRWRACRVHREGRTPCPATISRRC